MWDLWYNEIMIKNQYTTEYFNSFQLKLPLDIENLISIEDPVYTFRDVICHVDLKKYLVSEEYATGRPEYDRMKMLMIALFSFMEDGYTSLRNLSRRCRNDVRYIWLLDGMRAPSHAAFGYFIREELSMSIQDIFRDINLVIFELDSVDLTHVYLDGTKLEANSNKYRWVWKKSCETNRDKVFVYVSELLDEINADDLSLQGVCFEKREEYAVEYIDGLLDEYRELTGLDPETFVSGRGHRKSPQQRRYQKLKEYRDRLEKYCEHIEICGDCRNSYSKTDHDATFMRVKKDYMGNDQLLPAYNMQAVICDEYIAVVDAKQYASDMDCFVPAMEHFRELYGFYPGTAVADAGYGSFNNYLYCDEHGIEKMMKFPTFERENKDEKYRSNPFRAVNFKVDDEGNLVCPNGCRLKFKGRRPIKNNRYGRTEEVFQCDDCEGCPMKEKCCPRTKKGRTVNVNRELTAIHEEVAENLNTIRGALLRMNRSIQSEGTYGNIKWNHGYTRVYRRGIDNVELEFTLLACGYNLNKYHRKKWRQNPS